MAIFSGSRYTYFTVITVLSSVNVVAFISGTTLSWSSPVIPKLESNDTSDIPLGRAITDEEESWIASLPALGSIFGPFIFAFLAETIGRKTTAAILGVPYLVAFFIIAFAESIVLYYIGRILMGIGVGGVFSVLPIYIVETVHDVNRGILASSTTSFIMGGILFSYVLGPFVSIQVFNLVLAGLCVIDIPLILFTVPETPYYLASKNKDLKAKESLRYLRRKPSRILEEELAEIKSHLDDMKKGTVVDIFHSKASRKAFFISVALTTFQQFSGIIVILAFTQNIFDATGSDLAPEICSIIVGAVQFGTCFITPVFTDKFGRRRLFIFSISGATVALAALGAYFYMQDGDYDVSGISWLPVVSLVGYILFYNCGMGALPWSVMPELLPLNVISAAASTTTSIYWISGFFLTKFFGALSKGIGMGPSFWLFSGFCLLFDLFVYFFLMETKGKSLKEIQAILNK